MVEGRTGFPFTNGIVNKSQLSLVNNESGIQLIGTFFLGLVLVPKIRLSEISLNNYFPSVNFCKGIIGTFGFDNPRGYSIRLNSDEI
jgi:hypothetical protein